jgi:glycerol uptake facilitator-like aquaporin
VKAQGPSLRPLAAYITSAYWFTASTSFANPAVTVARALSDTFAGIRAADVPLFVIAQIVGAFSATFLFRWLSGGLHGTAEQIRVSRETAQPGE